ncbi:MAG: hypothetical protein NTW87_17515 [Planctomycetota bacterium]|nr:hypothetical protein [Planctomycetota bacterium]
MHDDWTPLIVVSVLLLPILLFLGHVLYTQVQAALLEFMLTLIVSTIPLGVLARQATMPGHNLEVPNAILAGLFPALIILAGSLWGLSAAKRLGEQRTWHRLGLMVVGWMIAPSFIAVSVGVICSLGGVLRLLFDRQTDPWLLLSVFLLPLGAPLVVAEAVERRCRAKAQAARTSVQAWSAGVRVVLDGKPQPSGQPPPQDPPHS